MKLLLFVSFLTIVILSPAFGQQAAPAPAPFVSLDKVMSKNQQKDMGLDNLTPDQKVKLESWLSNFALRMAQAGASVSSPGAARAASPGAYAGAGTGHWVKDKIDDGAMIRLEDGSLWEISMMDKINTGLWLPTEDITVVESKNPGYPFKLINSSSKDSAEAKYVGK